MPGQAEYVMKTVVGVDLGTQSLKVVFYDFVAREIVASKSVELDLYQNDEGAAEQQARWWVSALHEAFGKIDSVIRQSAIAVGVSGQQHGFVPLGKKGEVLAPVKLWCDTSTVTESALKKWEIRSCPAIPPPRFVGSGKKVKVCTISLTVSCCRMIT
jgi:sugar (pentulose or hexulose) kinase